MATFQDEPIAPLPSVNRYAIEVTVPTADTAQGFTFQQIHIDAVRNSSDDFNLFHDKNKWRLIRANPFAGPIVLGFQLECLIEYQMHLFRRRHGEDALIDRHRLRFSNYQLTFADVVRPEETVFVEIKPSHLGANDDVTLTNRVALKKEGGLVLIGYKKESQLPLFLPDVDLSQLPAPSRLPDRSRLDDSGFFLKRKFMNTGNAKNFLSGSQAEQDEYFDELEDKAHFPEIFPVSLVSCALLEHAHDAGHDFKRDPMVYTGHKISIARDLLAKLKSNDVLHILIKQAQADHSDGGLSGTASVTRLYHCLGVVGDDALLFRAEITMVSLDHIIKTKQHN